mmetsp:Transcript_6069/g.37625  ORF Transcript_6069/g.37625 Transcript_6069/m.37625 type:complete len:98 (+) Transcript_6069:700-993(+)
MLVQGENLAWGSTMTFDRAVELWYNTGSNYNYNSNSMGRSGHFTQVVWESSERVGCGIAQCSFGQLVVCQYEPSGNVRGQYSNNVKPPVRTAEQCNV